MASYIEQCLHDDIIPDFVDFTIDSGIKIDPYQIMYTDFYYSYQYVSSKFPCGIHETEFMAPVIDEIIEMNMKTTPLDEIMKLHDKNK